MTTPTTFAPSTWTPSAAAAARRTPTGRAPGAERPEASTASYPRRRIPGDAGGVFGQDCCCFGQHRPAGPEGGPGRPLPFPRREAKGVRLEGPVGKAPVGPGEDPIAAIRKAAGDPNADVREVAKPGRTPEAEGRVEQAPAGASIDLGGLLEHLFGAEAAE